jgi:hypothetical protein
MEYWSIGFDRLRIISSELLQYSSTPTLHYSKCKMEA